MKDEDILDTTEVVVERSVTRTATRRREDARTDSIKKGSAECRPCNAHLPKNPPKIQYIR